MLDKDTMWIFHAAEGYDIAIAESEIVAIWEAEQPENCLIERADGDIIEVEYAFTEITKDFDHTDTRKRVRKKVRKLSALARAVNASKQKRSGRVIHLVTSNDDR